MSSDPLDVWVVDDDQSVRWVLDKALRQAGMEVRSFERAEHVLEAMQTETPDVLITDVRMPGMTGIALLERLHEQAPWFADYCYHRAHGPRKCSCRVQGRRIRILAKTVRHR